MEGGGYPAVKIKVGRPDLREDVERVAAVREVIGPDTLLMVDANQRWDLYRARRAADALAPYGLHWLEEPLPADDVAAHVELRRSAHVPIAVGENVYTVYGFRDLLTAGACDVVQPNVVRVGGITPFLRIAELARTFDVPVYPHLLPDLSGQLALSLPLPSWPRTSRTPRSPRWGCSPSRTRSSGGRGAARRRAPGPRAPLEVTCVSCSPEPRASAPTTWTGCGGCPGWSSSSASATCGRCRRTPGRARLPGDLRRPARPDQADRADIAILATPIPTHAGLTLAALAAGAHVLVEKPTAATLADFERMEQAAARPGWPARWASRASLAAVPEVRRLIAGARSAASPVSGWRGRGRGPPPTSPAAPGRAGVLDGVDIVDGALTNPFAHAVATALAVAGAEERGAVTSVEAELFHANAIESDDTSAIRIHLADGPRSWPP